MIPGNIRFEGVCINSAVFRQQTDIQKFTGRAFSAYPFLCFLYRITFMEFQPFINLMKLFPIHFDTGLNRFFIMFCDFTD